MIIDRSLASSHLCLPFFLSLDLCLNRFPVDLDFLVELFEAIIALFLVVLLEESLTISNHSIDMRLLSYSNVQGFVPLVHLNVHLNSSIVETGRHEDLLSLVYFLAVERERAA